MKRIDSKGHKLPDGFSQRPDGRYMARFTFRGKRYTLYDMQLGELKRKVNQKKYELENGIAKKNYSNLTVDEWFKKWMDLYRTKGNYKFSTLQTQSASYDYYVKQYIGNMKLSEVKQIHIVELYQALYNRGLMYNTICKASCVISAMFRDALANDLIDKNPAIGAMKSIRKTNKKEKRALTREEQERFLNFVKTDPYYERYYNFYVVAFNTGMRVGELCGLTWDNIDFENDIIHVTKTLMAREDRVNGGGQKIVLNAPKTKKSKRDIPMLPVVKEALESQKEVMQYITVQAIDGVNNFCFCSNQESHVLKPRTIHQMLLRIVRNMNEREKEQAKAEEREPVLMQKFTPHEIRHTFTTRCFEAGMNTKVISEILGHSDLQMTMNVYTHVSQDMKAEEMSLIEE